MRISRRMNATKRLHSFVFLMYRIHMATYSKIITKKGRQSGPTLAIFAGVHGNEKTGVHVLDYLDKHIELDRGCLNLVYANLPALEKNIRFENKNLNRLFLKDIPVETYENTIANELMILLDGCDALLDLHAYHQPKGESMPFAICEENSFDIVTGMNIPYTLSGLHKFQRGSTDQYMFFNNKVGICLELGSLHKADEYIDLGINAALHMLNYFNMITHKKPEEPSCTPHHLEASEFYIKKHTSFVFLDTYTTFDYIPQGALIARDGDITITTQHDAHILFPRQDTPIGTEAYILAHKIK